jgi:hypothetical protein
VRLGLLLLNAATIVLVYRLGVRLADATAGLAAAAGFGALSLCPAALGFTANTEHFLLLPALGGLLLLLRFLDAPGGRTLFWSGLLFGVAVLMKQHAIFFAAFAGLLALLRELRAGSKGRSREAAARLAGFAAGVALPGLLVVLVLAGTGSLSKFWFWTVVYPSEYVTTNSLADGWMNLRVSLPPLLRSTAPYWGLAGFGLGALFVWERLWPARAFLSGLLVASLLAVSVGLTFRPHAFLLLAPALALLGGVAVAALGETLAGRGRAAWAQAAVIALVVAPLLYLFQVERDFLFRLDAASASRQVYNVNPFPESVEVGRYIRERSEPEDRIVVLGSEPQIYFYAGRRSATPYILTYPLMEVQPYARQMQEEMIEQIEAAQPRYLVFVNVYTSWLVRGRSERLILDWYRRYVPEHYRRVGLIDIAPEATRYFWDAAALDASPRSQAWLEVHERIGRKRSSPSGRRPPDASEAVRDIRSSSSSVSVQRTFLGMADLSASSARRSRPASASR